MAVLPPVSLISNDETLAAVIGDYLCREFGVECAVILPKKYDESTACLLYLWDAASSGSPPEGAQVTLLQRPVRLSGIASMINGLHKNSAQTVWQTPQVQLLFFAPSRSLQDGRGTSIALTDKEAALLACLLAAGEKGASRETLMREVWGYDVEAESQTLTTHLYRLRGKVKRLVGDAEIIANMAEGYRLNKGI